MTEFRPGDIIAISGRGWLANGIRRATKSPISHVAMMIGHDPPIVIEALTRVRTRPLDVCIHDAQAVWLLSDLSLTPLARVLIVQQACQFSAKSYGYGDLVLQLADAVFRTRWFTDRLTWGWLRRHPICSALVAEAYATVELTFDRHWQSVTPGDIWEFAQEHPELFCVTRLK